MRIAAGGAETGRPNSHGVNEVTRVRIGAVAATGPAAARRGSYLELFIELSLSVKRDFCLEALFL